MLDDNAKAAWGKSFGITYSVTLSHGELETSLLVRNTGSEPWEFQTLLHTYLKVDVSFPTSETPQENITNMICGHSFCNTDD